MKMKERIANLEKENASLIEEKERLLRIIENMTANHVIYDGGEMISNDIASGEADWLVRDSHRRS